MRSQRMPQIQDIRADKRFDALVRKEMQEQEHLISSHNKEMQMLREEFRLALQKVLALSEKSHKDLNDLRDQSEKHIAVLKDKVSDQAVNLAEQRKTIVSFHEQLNSFHDSQASKGDLDKFKKDIVGTVTDSTYKHMASFQDCQREFKEIFSSLKDELLKTRTELSKKISENMTSALEKFYQSQLDKEGIEREFSRYKKDLFYIEKKIENIYTLIERINKKGETCHKPG